MRNILLLLWLASLDARVHIETDRTVLVAGSSLHITCRVPPHADNRWVSLGIADYTSSAKTIEGELAPSQFSQLFKLVPCDVGPAFCRVGLRGGGEQIATQKLVIAGCE